MIQVDDYIKWTEEMGLSKYPYGSKKRVERLIEIMEYLLGEVGAAESVGGKDAEKHEEQGDRGGDKEDPEGVA